jgi:hypothetical protein
VKNKINTKHNLHKMNPGGHEVVRATIPVANSRVLTQFSQTVDLSLTTTYGEGKTLTRMKENANGGGERDGGSLILFNRAITQSQFCSWIQMSQTI